MAAEIPSQALVPVKTDVYAGNDYLWSAVQKLVSELPTLDTGSIADMALRLLAATTAEDYNAVFELSGLEDLHGIYISVQRISWAPSDYPGGLGIYLLVEGVDTESGEHVRFSTGAGAVILALASMAYRQQLPAEVAFYQSETETRSGYRPWNIRVRKLASPAAASDKA